LLVSQQSHAAPEEIFLPQPAQSTVQIDDERFRVVEWRFPPGSETGWHRHEMDYVVVPMTTGELRLQTSDGESTSHLTAGQPYTRRAGNEHNVINAGEHEFVFVEIEAK
jgi:beta-alanine degradation protein BauB